MSDYGADKKADMNVVGIIANDYNFMPLDKSNAMQWSSGTSVLNIKIANKQTHTNVHILIDTDQIE